MERKLSLFIRCTVVAFAAALQLPAARTLAAQANVPGRPAGPDGTPTRRVRPLGGSKDYAVSELKSVGFFNRQCVENAGIASFNCLPFFQVMKDGLVAINPEGSGLELDWGTTVTTWDSAKAKVPSLANAVGGGYTVVTYQSANTDLADAADNSLGLHHAGVSSTSDKSCLDHSNAFGAGLPLLAGSDCPATWGSEGFKGARAITQDVFVNRFNADPTNFAFDFWKVSDAEIAASGTDKPIGNFVAYGYESDHTAEVLCGSSIYRTYGNVIPATSQIVPGGCSGAPTKPGWPLGIDMRIDAFSFQLPSLKEIAYYQAVLVNNSQKVYGVALDYDSLYVNLNNGWYGGDQRQQQINYQDPSRGAWIIQTGPLKPCAVAREVVDLTCTAGAWGAVGITLGFHYGAAAMIVLKSPIGDLRNKWFSKVGSPFYNPANVHAGDTITFNHGHLCGFRACARNSYATNPATTPDHEQRMFGMMSSTEANVFGTRAPSGLTPQVYWHTFRNWNFDNQRWTPGVNPMAGTGFNRWIPPGNWDYNHDGTPDTLYLDSCAINGCVKVWGDTFPNGKYAAYSNVGSTLGIGPIKLNAGDTTSFVFAITTGQSDDSSGFEAQVANAIDNYMNFFLTPNPAPPCHVTGVTRGVAAEGTQIDVTWDDACFATVWTDAFLAKQYADMEAATAGTNAPLTRIRQLNPWLDDTLLFLSTHNFKALYVFKSCNDGGVWTQQNDCVTGNPATGGEFADLGWLPLATYKADDVTPTSPMPTSYVDRNILAGKTYTYNLIGQTRGAVFTILNGDSVTVIGTDTVCAKNCRVETLSLAPSLFDALSASTGNVNVARAYIPLSMQAGASHSKLVMLDSLGVMPSSRIGAFITADSLAADTFRVKIADSAHVTRREYRTAATLDSIHTSLVLRVPASQGSTLTVNGGNFGGLTLSGASYGGAVVDSTWIDTVAGNPRNHSRTSLTATMGSGPVLALYRHVGGRDTNAVLLSNTLTGTSTTPGSFHSNANYPDFDVSLDKTLADKVAGEVFYNADGSVTKPLVVPTVSWLPDSAVANVAGTGDQANGTYRITWGAAPYGPGEPFRLNFADPTGTANGIAASLTSRAAVSQTVATDSAATAVQAVLGGIITKDSLAVINLPFSVQNATYNRPVLLAILKRNTLNRTVLVGFGADTIRVNVPGNVWVPGDLLVAIERLGVGGTGAQTASFSKARIACNQVKYVRLSCNPVYAGTRGAPELTVYLGETPGQVDAFTYYTPVTSASQFTLLAVPPLRGTRLTALPLTVAGALAEVRTVPNPFVMLSQYGPDGERGQRMMFTHLPPRGVIRMYTVAGQFVQQIRWTEADLGADGDLTWNMRTREGNSLGAGLYLYVITAEDANGRPVGSRINKFVVIR
jgi:hypothetical protein